MPRLSVAMVFFLLLSISACNSSSSSSGGGSLTKEQQLQEHLEDFNLALDESVLDMLSLVETIQEMDEHLMTGNDQDIDILLQRFEDDTHYLLESVEFLEAAEAGIRGAIKPEERALGLTTLIGAGLVISGLYSFARYCRGKSDEMSEARNRRDEAMTDNMNNVPGAQQRYDDSRQEMTDIGADVAMELTTRVTTEMVFSPVNPSSLAGTLLKEDAGNAFRSGLRVVSTTEPCKQGIDSEGCIIGIGETDESGMAEVAGSKETTIVIGGDDVSRVVIDDVHILPGTTKEIVREQILIDDATADIIAANDAGDYVPGADPVNGTQPPAQAMTVSYAQESVTDESITYQVSAAISGITSPVQVKIELQNALTSGATRTLNQDGTITWSVTVLRQDGVVTVSRSDSGERQSLTLPGVGDPANNDQEIIGTWFEEEWGDVFTFHANGTLVIAHDDGYTEYYKWEVTNGMLTYVSDSSGFTVSREYRIEGNSLRLYNPALNYWEVLTRG